MQLAILWWLAPAVLMTVAAMVWVVVAGRAAGRELDRDDAVRRMEQALRKDNPVARRVGSAATKVRDRSTGIAVRPSRGE